jgi:MFS-type transporter involved in bile tolerance (Atg22 family)
MRYLQFMLIICSLAAVSSAPSIAQVLPDSMVSYLYRSNGDSVSWLKIDIGDLVSGAYLVVVMGDDSRVIREVLMRR